MSATPLSPSLSSSTPSSPSPIMPYGLSLPAAFLDRMKAMLGKDFLAFCASYEKPVRPSLRVNALRMEPSAAGDVLPFLGDPVPWQSAGYYYAEAAARGDVRPGKHPLHEAGAYYIQEASAMLPASLCTPAPGERVLDLCAAPGGKATQLAAALNGAGLLVANEIHPGRAAILSQNLERMGVRNALVTNASPDELAERFPAFFDRIVVDAPCSGEGMFRKEPDAVKMWSQENVALCAARQAEILDAAAKMLRPGGTLTYSTCTFAPAENEGAVMEFLLRHKDFSVILSDTPEVLSARAAGLLDGGEPDWVEDAGRYPADIREAARLTYRVLPHHADGEGHFAALLRREAETVPSSEAAAPTASSDFSRALSKPVPSPEKGGNNRNRCAPGRNSPSSTGRNGHSRVGNNRNGTGRSNDSQSGNSRNARERTDLDCAVFSLFTDFCGEVNGGLPTWIEGMTPCLFGDHLCLVPSALGASAEEVRAALRGLRVLRAGLCVGVAVGLESGRGRFEPDHALAMAWLCHTVVAKDPSRSSAEIPENSRQGRVAPTVRSRWSHGGGTVEFTVESTVDPLFGDATAAACAYLRGEPLPAPDVRGWHIVTYAGLPLGWGKASNGIMKNHYPKGLRWS